MDKKNDINKQILSTVLRYAKILRKEKIPVAQMIVFGSQAHGNPKGYSDIDVCVVSPSFGKDSIAERVLLTRLAEDVDWRIEPHPYHPADFAVEEDPFAAEIKRTGITI